MSQAVEKRIVTEVVQGLLAAGLTVTVFDGEEDALKRSTDQAAILAALFQCDEEWLYTKAKGPDGSESFVRLVYGNGADVIADYGVSLEDALTKANALAEAEA